MKAIDIPLYHLVHICVQESINKYLYFYLIKVGEETKTIILIL